MAEFTSYDRGVPCWVDLMTSDPPGAREFYTALFGWDYEIDPDPQTQNYAQATIRGKRVAGLGGEPAPDGLPTAWTTYLASSDLDADAKAIADAGGQVMTGPMQIRDQGGFLIALDPTGAAIGLWQAGSHFGAQLANEPGSVTWNDLQTRDFEGAQRFYETLFGCTFSDMSGPGFDYVTIDVNGRAVGGIMRLPGEVPAEMPPFWTVTFAVEDADATAAKVQALGGTVVTAPNDTEFGRRITLADPQGGAFGVIGPVPSG